MHGLEGEIGYQSGSKVRILTTCHQIAYLLRRLISSVGGSCRHRPGTVFLKPTVGSLIAKQSEQQTSSYFKQPSQPNPRPLPHPAAFHGLLWLSHPTESPELPAGTGFDQVSAMVIWKRWPLFRFTQMSTVPLFENKIFNQKPLSYCFLNAFSGRGVTPDTAIKSSCHVPLLSQRMFTLKVIKKKIKATV